MKRVLIIAGIVTLCLAAVIGAALGYMVNRGFGFSEGYVLVTDSGSRVLILDDSPVQLRDGTKRGTIVHKLETGDKVLVLHGGVEETYPARTGAYAVIKLSNNKDYEAPESIVAELTELGWLGTKPESASGTEDGPGHSTVTDGEKYLVAIEDRTTPDMAFAQALELIYSDGEFEYYFSCIKSGVIFAVYSDGSEEGILTALESGRAAIEDLDRFGIHYYKEPAVFEE